MKEIVIFGTGDYGKLAYYYYGVKYQVKCFIDNNPEKQGTEWNGVPVYGPGVIKGMVNPTIVIAVGERFQKEIEKQLYQDYGIRQAVIFSVQSTGMLLDNSICQDSECDVVISYCGGLGNQMFQYAFSQYLKWQGKYVKDDISFWGNIDYQFPFSLENVFPDIILCPCSITEKKKKKWMEEGIDYQNANDLLHLKGIFLLGYWITYKYADCIRGKLLKDFTFCGVREEKLLGLLDEVQNGDYTSIHIRRGDYLNEKEWKIYGNICTEDYYKKAVGYIRVQSPDSKFLVFSNDMHWVKQNFKVDRTIYIERTLFRDYQDWYDMLLMSNCKNNIIANSTFSWWGAWLNRNPDKIVIAPDKWINGGTVVDIYPPGWIRL